MHAGHPPFVIYSLAARARGDRATKVKAPRLFPAPMGHRLAAGALVALLAIAVAVVLAIPGQSNANGAWDATERGCYCHGPLHSPAVGFSVEGLPGQYTPGANYTLYINITFTDVAPTANRSQGGFFVEATAGHFSPAPGWEDLVQARDNQTTQTKNGSMMRHWAVNWTAPDQAGLIISFFAFANAVNGNRSESLGTDHWTYKTIRVGVGDQPEIIPPPPPQSGAALETAAFLVVAAAAGAFVLISYWRIRKFAKRTVKWPEESKDPPPPPSPDPPH